MTPRQPEEREAWPGKHGGMSTADGTASIGWESSASKKMDEAVSEAELRQEVEKAKSFSPKIKEYILVTTARRDAGIQKVAREITDELTGTEHEFSVSVWDGISSKSTLPCIPMFGRRLIQHGTRTQSADLDQIRVSIGELKGHRFCGVARRPQ